MLKIISIIVDNLVEFFLENTDVKDKKLTLRLLFLLKEFDDRLMKESVETISKWDLHKMQSFHVLGNVSL